MTRTEILDTLRRAVASENPHLPLESITELSSLSGDLGMDSLRLESLAATVRRTIGAIDLTPWYARIARRGDDTLASLADYLVERRTPRGGPGDTT